MSSTTSPAVILIENNKMIINNKGFVTIYASRDDDIKALKSYLVKEEHPRVVLGEGNEEDYVKKSLGLISSVTQFILRSRAVGDHLIERLLVFNISLSRYNNEFYAKTETKYSSLTEAVTELNSILSELPDDIVGSSDVIRHMDHVSYQCDGSVEETMELMQDAESYVIELASNYSIIKSILPEPTECHNVDDGMETKIEICLMLLKYIKSVFDAPNADIKAIHPQVIHLSMFAQETMREMEKTEKCYFEQVIEPSYYYATK